MKTVLDLGCGTGIWARTMAAQYSNTNFIGVDINPPFAGDLQTAGNNNCRFVKANVEDTWDFAEGEASVDFVFGGPSLYQTDNHQYQVRIRRMHKALISAL